MMATLPAPFLPTHARSPVGLCAHTALAFFLPLRVVGAGAGAGWSGPLGDVALLLCLVLGSATSLLDDGRSSASRQRGPKSAVRLWLCRSACPLYVHLEYTVQYTAGTGPLLRSLWIFLSSVGARREAGGGCVAWLAWLAWRTGVPRPAQSPASDMCGVAGPTWASSR